ncbi:MULTISPECIES: hypothetical protein [unclassified Streptomyces]|uniref:hypothetical protein n=1 Tax=unclassified Streptomyces TaxID=2593676 RepID=UPI000FA9A104|nr:MULTISPECIES: hypothetical protein [unclassified Streptomyces]MCX4773395.1 hypothetical protein [Streptomyces sp. NBC_01285]ROQ74037.1 hypothetical protein EDD95_6730 [Streptomyces sp. CEV 2-1]
MVIHCNSPVRPPWFRTAQAHRQAGIEELPDRLICELGKGHTGEHADCLDTMGRGTFDVWLRWNGDDFTYVCAAPCEQVDPTIAPLLRQACWLFTDHEPGHSWEFEDLPHD